MQLGSLPTPRASLAEQPWKKLGYAGARERWLSWRKAGGSFGNLKLKLNYNDSGPAAKTKPPWRRLRRFSGTYTRLDEGFPTNGCQNSRYLDLFGKPRCICRPIRGKGRAAK